MAQKSANLLLERAQAAVDAPFTAPPRAAERGVGVKIYYWRAAEGNVGDDLNLWLWPRVFRAGFFDEDDATRFVGIGSVLDRRHETAARRIVFGAGARGPEGLPDPAAPGWEVAFVRGPNTAGAMGLGRDRWITDPAALAPLADPRFAARAGGGGKTPERVGFVPYFATGRGFAEAAAGAAGLTPIPPTLDPERFFAALLACDAVVVEAMHGAILADAFGVPWKPCRLSSRRTEGATHRFKWEDWLLSLDLPCDAFEEIPYSARPLGRRLIDDVAAMVRVRQAAGALRRMAGTGGWLLSDRSRLAEAQQAMLGHVRALEARVAEGAGGVAG